MNILDIIEETHHTMRIPDGPYGPLWITYRRYGPDSWEVLMGDSWEACYGFESQLEDAFNAAWYE